MTDYHQNQVQAMQNAAANKQSLAMPSTKNALSSGGGVHRVNDSAPAFDAFSVASSRPGTRDGAKVAVAHNQVRKVQSSAFVSSAAQDRAAQANKIVGPTH